MLLLVRTDGHQIALIKKYVACHQHRVGEKACVYIVRVLCGFILELCHSGELAHIGVAAQHPVKLSVLVNVGLHKQYGFFGIYAAGQQQRHSLAGAPSQVGGVLANGQGVKIGDAVIAEPVIGLQELPIFERTNVIAQGGGARGLYAAEYCLLFLFCHFIYITSMISPVHIKILYFI